MTNHKATRSRGMSDAIVAKTRSLSRAMTCAFDALPWLSPFLLFNHQRTMGPYSPFSLRNRHVVYPSAPNR